LAEVGLLINFGQSAQIKRKVFTPAPGGMAAQR